MPQKNMPLRIVRLSLIAGAMVIGMMTVLFSLPYALAWTYRPAPQNLAPTPFPVTVDPLHKTIHEDPVVDAMLSGENSPLTAAGANADDAIGIFFSAITSSPWYQGLAAADAPHIVFIAPGYRKEQVALAFGTSLGWSTKARTAFLAATSTQTSLPDGTFAPGTYAVELGNTPAEVRALVSTQFENDILSHYSTSTAAIVPLSEALTIASMLERETNNTDEMRSISGIIWNRLFAGMKLQVDATVQYAKASAGLPRAPVAWWPPMLPRDAFIKSPYNTYQNVGLPPAPISNPSVAAVLAALNPKQTSCVYYFHDSAGGFHCSITYPEHVALLKKYYGQGK